MPRTTRLVRRIDAPVATVWDVLTDHARYPEWTPVPGARFTPAPGDDPNGVGATRLLGLGPLGTTERVVASEPRTHLAYSIVAGAPVRDHLAEVDLTDEGEATTVVYRARFRPLVPFTGAATGLLMRTVLRTLLSALARESERRATADRAA